MQTNSARKFEKSIKIRSKNFPFWSEIVPWNVFGSKDRAQNCWFLLGPPQGFAQNFQDGLWKLCNRKHIIVLDAKNRSYCLIQIAFPLLSASKEWCVVMSALNGLVLPKNIACSGGVVQCRLASCLGRTTHGDAFHKAMPATWCGLHNKGFRWKRGKVPCHFDVTAWITWEKGQLPLWKIFKKVLGIFNF